MPTKLIQLEDGTLVEVEVPPNQVSQVSGGVIKQVNNTFDVIKPLLIKVCRPVAAAWNEINQDMNIEEAEVELGLSFGAEGNLYVTKTKANANLTVKLKLKPRST